jgi:DNA-directed RNA polymerase subunit K/omega
MSTKQNTDTSTVKDNDILSNIKNTDTLTAEDNNIKYQNKKIFNSKVLSLKKVETLNRLTKYERARIIGTRASQIQNGMSAVFIKDGIQIPLPDEYKDVVKDSVDLAKLELKLKSCPLIIRRLYPSGKIIEKTIQEFD